MPGYDTHYIVGIHGYRKLTDTMVKKYITSHKAPYCLGLFGPDTFFYYATEIMAARKNIGSIMHTSNISEFFKHMLTYIELHRGETRETAISYLAGFFSHYTVDCICHPYVYWCTDYLHKEKNYLEKHFYFESAIDYLMLKNYKNTTPYMFKDNVSYELSDDEMAIICDMLYFSIRSTYHDSRITRSGIKMAILSLKKEERVIRIASSRFFNFIPHSKDYTFDDPLNLGHKPWKNPWNIKKISTDSVPAMLNKATDRFYNIILLFEKFLQSNTDSSSSFNTLIKFIGNRSYHSGLDCHIKLL